jgi:arylsulfatase A-like enzyme
VAAPDGSTRPARSRLAAAVAIAFVAAGLLARPRSAEPAARPSLVLFVWDTVRADRVGCYGAKAPTSPFLDAIARRGVRFANAVAPAPWTAPSHASLFTGLLPARHGLRHAAGETVLASVPLLAQTLRGAGYETVAVSGNANVSAVTGLHRGFEHFLEYYEDDDPVARPRRALDAVLRWRDGRRVRRTRGDDRPVFLFVNLMSAHLPYAPSDACLGPVRPAGLPDGRLAQAREVGQRAVMAHNLGLRRLPEGTLAGMRALYDGGVRECDRSTGAILHALRGEGILDGALVAVTSDHGENLGEHGLVEHRFSVHETLLRVPLVLHQEGRWDGGRVEAVPVSLLDLYPTLLEAAGVRAPPGAGTDAVPLGAAAAPGRHLLADYAAPEHHIATALQHLGAVEESALLPMRTSLTAVYAPAEAPRRLKLVRRERAGADGEPGAVEEELFDLGVDPGEGRDLLEGPGDEPTGAEALRGAARAAGAPHEGEGPR